MYFINCFLFHNHEQVQPFSWSDLSNFDRLHLKKEKKKKGTRFTHLLNRPHALSPVSPPAERSRHHSHAQFSSAQHSPRPFPLTPSTASDSETESSLPLRHGAITPWQRGLFISHQVKSGFLSLLCGGEIGPQHSKSLMNTMRTEAPAPSRSSLSHASHCPPGAVGWPRRTPASAPSATCGTDRTDRTDRFYAAAGRASSSLSAENRLRMQPQAQGPGGDPPPAAF